MKRKLVLVPVLALSALGTVGLAAGSASAATNSAPASASQDPWPGHHNHYDYDGPSCNGGLLNLVLLANCD
ncbi:hypothetical protein [Actinomadura hibisca]|uniref:hypothetical protein n=1 Tax=Actinomadura hibisca TaxID=68565 RepID=UPI00082ACF8C|nr:hypothetical protein [Actinomadura hibisca]